MNETISAVLREHADGDIHIEHLLSTVRAGARRRRRDRIALAGGAAVVIAASAVVTAAVIQRPGSTVAVPAPEAGVPRPPYTDRAPSVVQAPEVFGTDPTLFHLDLTELEGWKYLAWSSVTNHEELTMTTTSGAEVLVEGDRDPDRLRTRYGTPQPVTVNGLPAEASTSGGRHVVRWQPIPRLWAQVIAPGPVEDAVRIAERVRLDRVYRCAVPFRLTGITPARLVKCETFFSVDDTTGLTSGGGVWFTMGDDAEYQVAVGKADQSIAVNDTIGDRAVESTEGNGGHQGSLLSWQIRYPYGDGRAAYFWAYGPPDVPLLRSTVAGFVRVDGDDVNAWPRNPFS
jgi:hypothetical protein